MRVKLPRLLTAGMQEKARLHPLEAEIEFNMDPPSTALITIPATDETVNVRDWVELYTKDGSAGIYRVTDVETNYDAETVRLTLEHGICALGDAVIPGNGTHEGTLGQLLPALMGYQVAQANGAALWTLGEVCATRSVRHDYYSPNLLTELLALVARAGEVMLTFDQSRLPWTMHLTALTDGDICEGRFGRNLQSIAVDVDDTELCTRLYVEGEEGYRDADTVSQYGIVARSVNVSGSATEASREQYIAEYLEAHKAPAIAIEMSMADMSEATGESLDSIRLGRMCRACLPEYNAVVRHRVVSIRYPDVYGDPQDVRVSLGRKTANVSDLLLEEQEKSAANSSTSSRYYGSSSTRITNAEIELYKSQLELAEFQGQTVERFNEVYIDLDEINAEIALRVSQKDFAASLERISQAEIRISGAEAKIELKADLSITDALGSRVSQAEVDIDGANAQIALKASQSSVDAIDGRVSQAESELIVQSDAISTKVSKDGVISSINQTAESVVISASRIDLSGYVTASQLEANFADIGAKLETTQLIADQAEITGDLAVSGDMHINGELCTWKSKTVQTSIPSFNHATITLANGNTISVVTGWADAPSSYRSTIYYLGYV